MRVPVDGRKHHYTRMKIYLIIVALMKIMANDAKKRGVFHAPLAQNHHGIVQIIGAVNNGDSFYGRLFFV